MKKKDLCRLYPFILIFSILGLYFSVIDHDFLYLWDDQWVVINQYTTGGLNWNNISDIFCNFYHGQYAPFNELNYLFIYSIWDYNPMVFHLVSLCWHLLNVLLVYLVIYKLLSTSDKLSTNYNFDISFFTALLWGVHPVNVESVAWISASKVLIYTFFYLISVLVYLDYVKKQTLFKYILVVAFFVCSFLGKEQAVVFPLLLLLLDWILGRNLRKSDVWIEKIPFFILAIFLGIITIFSQGVDEYEIGYTFLQRICFASYSLFEYFLKCLFPYKLLYLYPFPILQGDELPIRFYIYPIIIILIICSIYQLKKYAILVFSSIFFLIHVLVSLHLISISRFAITADRYVYISCISLAFVIVYSIFKIKSILTCKKYFTLIFLFYCYFLYLSSYTYCYIDLWRDTDSLKKELRELLNSRDDIKRIKEVKELMNIN